MNKLELLSPAGDINIFKAVVNAGADAVYFGGDLFGARAYAKNFTIEEAAEAIRYAHLHGAKAYLTVNTLLKNLEMEQKLYSYLKAYVESGIDAFIVQDFGVMQMIKSHFPDTEIHVSTQVSLCTEHGAKLFEDFGATRIVTARELGINEIAKIHEKHPDLEIESFIHGALCVCYSGQCLMSSIIGGRSGNRGRCAQPCRLPYSAYNQNGKKLDLPGEYILSPKDFCTIENLPEMIKAGVVSFKIEGRMKQINYATGVVSVYRKYIDQYLYKGEKGYSVSQNDIQKLLDFGNRSGFTDLYLNGHNGKEMITFAEPSHSKNDSNNQVFDEKKIKINCKVRAILGEELSVCFYNEDGISFEAKGNIVEESKSKPASREDIIKAVSALGNTNFEVDNIITDYDDNIFLPVSWLKSLRREAIEGFLNLYFNEKDYRINEFKEVKEKKGHSWTNADSVFVNVDNIEQFKACLKYDFVKRICVPVSLFEEAMKLNSNKEIYVALPTIIRADYIDKLNISDMASGVLVSSFDGLGYINSINYPKDKVILDHRMYSFSNRAVEAFDNELGFSNNCIPYELSLKEIAHRNNENSQMIIYSRIPLMVTANCTLKNSIGCRKENTEYSLLDRKNMTLPVKCNCDYCYNTIYNSKKYNAFLLKDELVSLGAKEFRIDFTLEDAKEVSELLEKYEAIFIDSKVLHIDDDFTYGHLKRGVE